MEEFNDKMKELRKILEESRDKKYAIVNPVTVDLNEYIKTLYLEMLCTVIWYENNPTKMQELYLKRIVNGIEAEASTEEYMRKALEISGTDVQEFLEFMKDEKAKYYFILDGLLLASMGNPEQGNCEYLAELIELLDVTVEDLEYLSLVAKSVLQQQSLYYDEAKKVLNERVKELDFTPYIQNYYAGAIIDTDDEKYYSAPDKKLSESIEYPSIYKGQTVVFENLNIEITDEWFFQGCEEVIFKNCYISGEDKNISFCSVGTLRIEDCVIKGFSNRFALLSSINEFIVNGSKFIECGYTRDKGKNIEPGGVFLIRSEKMHTISFSNNKILNCYSIDKLEWDHCLKKDSVFIGFQEYIYVEKFKFTNNEIYGCVYKCDSWDYITDEIIGNFYGSEQEVHDNKCTGVINERFM